jgi:hypothetical protein
MGPWLALTPWWTHDHGVARSLSGSGGHHDSAERERERERGGEGGRERRSLGFSPMAPLRGRVVEMGTRQRLTKAADGALMGRWFQV